MNDYKEYIPTPPEETPPTDELTPEPLIEVTAGIDHMTKEELQTLKDTITSYGTDELTIDELGNVMAGTPLSYEEAQAEFEEHVPSK